MHTCKILIVEDERIVAIDLRQRLLQLGYEITATVVSGKQAVKHCKSLRPDLVLMDIHIEGELDGIDAAEVIYQTLHIPIIYLTAYSEESTLNQACKTKPYGYLLKPYTEQELHATIQIAMERSRTDLNLAIAEMSNKIDKNTVSLIKL